MFRSVRVGKLFGIPLFIHPTFLLLPAWVAWNNPGVGPAALAFLLVCVLALFACVVLHELGHALTARAFGIGTRDITLYPIGGVARLEKMSEKPAQELCIALAGPAVNLVIFLLLLIPVALLGFVVGPEEVLSLGADGGAVALVQRFLTVLCVSNLLLLLFNLLPCFPMDGGRVLRALLSMGLGLRRATEIAAWVSIPVAVLVIGALALYSHNPLTAVLIVFVILAGQAELRAIRWREAQQQARPQAVPLAQPLVLSADGPAPQELNADFSGYTWNRDYRVWVLWRQGRPVAFWRPSAAE
jgi:Zn-dependent protease